MEIKKINIIGFGNVGQILFNHLKDRLHIVSIYTKNVDKEKVLITDGKITNDLSKMSIDVDLNLIAVKDGAIKDVAQQLPKFIPTVHTSGGKSILDLKEFECFGIIYPLQTFSKGVDLNLSEIPFFIEGNTQLFSSILIRFSKKFLSEKTFKASSEKRKHIHLSAILTSNFLNYFLCVADKILVEKSLTIEILQPLLEETIKKAVQNGPLDSMTGPAIRGDKELIQVYTNLIKDSSFKKLFKEINDRISSKQFTVL